MNPTAPLQHATCSRARHRLAWSVAAACALCGLALAADAPPPENRAEVTQERLTSRPREVAPAVPTAAVGDVIRTESGQRRRLSLPDGATLYVNENTSVKLEEASRLDLSAGEVYVENAPVADKAPPLVIKTPQREVSGRQGSFVVRAAKAGTGVLVTRGQASVSGLDDPLRAGQQLTPGSAKAASAPRASLLLDWTRELRAADSPLVPGSKHAGGALVAVDPNGQETKLTLRKCHIDVLIEDGFARTTIDQTYFNDSSSQMEGTFYFPLPSDASLSQLAMYVDGNLMEGGMVERELGRNIYETIRYRNRDPALLEWVDGSTFKMRVFPIEGRQEKRLFLSYTQKLPSLYEQTQYRFPAGHSLPSVRDWSFHARVKHAAALAWNSPSHPLQATKDGSDLVLDGTARDARFDRDVVLAVGEPALAGQAADKVRLSMAEQDGARYLMVRFRPDQLRPANDGEQAAPGRQPRNWVFLFESSGDREPLLARLQIEVVRGLLAQAEADDTFTVLTAGTRVRVHNKEPRPVTPDNVKAALAFLDNSHLIGALDLGLALTEAEAILKKTANSYLVHVGTGIAAMGDRREDVLAKRIPAGTRYVGVGVGRRWSRSFMKTAAERSGGYFTQINPDEPVSWRVFDLGAIVQTLAGNRSGDVEVSFEPARGRVQLPPRVLYYTRSLAPGEELCAVTRLEAGAELPAEISVRFAGGEPVAVPVRGVRKDADYLPRAWAKLEIERLLAEHAVKHKNAIIALSKAMYVMTPYTSLLVLENEDMYTQYKVDRNRKDKWAAYPCPQKIHVVYEPDPDQPDFSKLKAGQKLPARQVGATVQDRRGLSSSTRRGEGQWLPAPGTPSRIQFAPAFISPGMEWAIPPRLEMSRQALIAGLTDQLQDLHRNMAAIQQTSGLLTPPQQTDPKDVAKIVDDALKQRDGRPGTDLSEVQRRLDELEMRNNELLSERSRRPAENEEYFLSGLDAPAASFNTKDKWNQVGSDLAMTAAWRDGVWFSNKNRDFTFHVGGWLQGDFVWDGQAGMANPVDRNLALISEPYSRPRYLNNDQVFYDLVAYAPGLDTGYADILAVLEAESLPSDSSKPGHIDPAARTLLEKARPTGWQTLTLPEEGGRSACAIAFDGQGRYAYERLLPPGIREQVVCDGQTLLHLYPQLGLGARRPVSRFHRGAFSSVVPYALPTPEEMARGADLKVVGPRTVAVVPHGADAARDKKGQPISYSRLHLVFGEDGSLTERQIVRQPEGKVLLRQVCSAEGVVRVLNADGKELRAVRGQLKAGKQPDLSASTKGLVVLPLPYRTRDYLVRTLKLQGKAYADMPFANALSLLAADFASGNSAEMLKVFREAFHGRDQRQLGFYVLLAAAGHSLDSQNVDVLAEYRDEPLAQYLTLHSSPVLRKHAAQWAIASVQWNEPFLRHLAQTHALYQLWGDDSVLKGAPARVNADRLRALDYVRKHKDSVFGWALLCLLQDRAGENKQSHGELAEYFKLFEDQPSLAYAARYEQARCLVKSGQRQQARKLFRELYERTLDDEVLPAVDMDFRQALQGDADTPDLWSELLQKTAERLPRQKQRRAVLALAKQAWQLGDPPLANQLAMAALAGKLEEKERLPLTLAVIDFFQENSQLPQADELLEGLLADAKLSKRADLWRLAAKLAEKRDMTGRGIECLERAVDLEFQKLPKVIDINTVREEYKTLLSSDEAMLVVMNRMKMRPSADFVAKVIRTADRWRALDQEAGQPCQAAAKILRALGDRDLAWEYLTTPIGLQPGESRPWVELATTLQRTGDRELADRAYKSACETEPTNADLLWERADNLRRSGKAVAAQEVFRQIAEGSWQPRFQPTQARARVLLAQP